MKNFYFYRYHTNYNRRSFRLRKLCPSNKAYYSQFWFLRCTSKSKPNYIQLNLFDHEK